MPPTLAPAPLPEKKEEPRSILPPGPLNPFVATPPAGPAFGPPESHFREFGDHKATRRRIYDNVLTAAKNLEPLSNARHTLRLRDVAYEARDHWTPAERKHALLTGGTLARRLHGTWELLDNATGKVIDRKAGVVARVPHLTDLGTFVNNGSDYTLNHQQRLRAGVFARRKENGELESHVNVLPGKGLSHRYLLDPEKGVFKIKVSQSEMPLLPLLRAMGATDKELIEHWGDKLFQANQLKSEGGVLKKLQDRLLRKEDREHPDEGHRRQKLVDAFHAMELDPEVTRHTLGHPHSRLDKDVILKATRKLLQVNRGEAEVDDRDHLAYQYFLGPEDLIAERVARDHGKLRRNLFFKASLKGHLQDFPSSAMTPQVEQAILGSGLGQAIEEINPAEVFDKQTRITRMGEGGIPSLEAIPDEARGVQPSHAMFMDPVRTPESFRVGVDVHMARNARKGADGRVYTQLRDPRTGQTHWKAPQELHDAAIAFPGGLAARTKRIPVMKGGRIEYAKKRDVDFVMPHFEGAFSPLGNMVPIKSATKAQRMAMASRMLTQALPLVNAEAPLVQSAVPGTGGTRSFEDEYGKHMGAVRSPAAGRVVKVDKDGVRVRYADGRSETHELYDHYPFNRKTFLHHTPLVKPGDDVRPGQLLAKSNYTDHNGTTALGTNLYTAYVPWKGYNFQDAIVVSESAARAKLRSEHSYHHEVQVDDKHKMGKRNYVSLFPGKFDRTTLDALDDNGVVRPGTVVDHGHPLILAARERDRAENKVHKKGQAGYHDQAVVWKHHDPGVVTDVVMGKGGPVVLVKSHAPMQVGDKMSGRYGDKGVVAAIVPDHQMPHDKDGKPFEVLLNPNGIISRTNPSQKIELWLGKVARHTGQAHKAEDFGDVQDWTAHAHEQLRRHGLRAYEDVVDPETGRKIPNVATGHRFYMKLHHTAESKGQGRGGGGYSMDETPSKGGETGCFVGLTSVQTDRGFLPIELIVRNRLRARACSRPADPAARREPAWWCAITDWFACRVPPEDLVEIRFNQGDRGRSLVCTRGHELVLSDGRRVRAGDVRPGDDLMEGRQ